LSIRSGHFKCGTVFYKIGSTNPRPHEIFIIYPCFFLNDRWLIGFVIYSVGAIMHILLAVDRIFVLVAIFNAYTKKSEGEKEM
jgi:uncharacterized membrane protein